MPPDPDKRKLRELKRVLKRRGNKHRRQELKRDLSANPEEAANSAGEFGRHRSDTLNGLDRDSTRKRDDPPGSPRAAGARGRPDILNPDHR